MTAKSCQPLALAIVLAFASPAYADPCAKYRAQIAILDAGEPVPATYNNIASDIEAAADRAIASPLNRASPGDGLAIGAVQNAGKAIEAHRAAFFHLRGTIQDANRIVVNTFDTSTPYNLLIEPLTATSHAAIEADGTLAAVVHRIAVALHRVIYAGVCR